MAKVNYSLSTKVDLLTERTPILIRFIGGRDSIFRTKSGFTVNPKRWNSKDGTVIIPRIETPEQKELAQLQKKLSELAHMIVESFLSSDKAEITKEWLNRIIDEYHFPEKYHQQEIAKLSFFDAVDQFLATKKISQVRKKNYGVVFRGLKRYELLQQKTKNKYFSLDLDTLTCDNIRDIENFMLNEFKLCEKYPELYKDVPEYRTPKPRGLNTINCSLTKLRTFINWALTQKLTSNNPFIGFETPEAIYGTPYYLTILERNQLYQFDLSDKPELAIQRDIFVFQCLIGCRISDLYSLTKGSIINGAIEYIARKTKEGNPVTVRVPLNSTAKEIVDRYKDTPGHTLFPFTFQQWYNEAIKSIFAEVGLTRMVTVINPTTRQEEKRPLNEIASSHLARRTFVGNLYKKVKDPNLVGALSGHKEGSRAFARYREIDDEMKQELVNLLD